MYLGSFLSTTEQILYLNNQPTLENGFRTRGRLSFKFLKPSQWNWTRIYLGFNYKTIVIDFQLFCQHNKCTVCKSNTSSTGITNQH